MRVHRADPAAAVAWFDGQARPYRPASSDGAAVLAAYRDYARGVLLRRYHREFPGSVALLEWEREAGKIVGRDHERLSAAGRRGARRSADVRQSARVERNRDIWRWFREGRGPLAIMADVGESYPSLAIGVRRIYGIVAERRERAKVRRAVKVERRAAARRRERVRRDALAVARLKARDYGSRGRADGCGAAVRHVAASLGVSPATVRRAWARAAAAGEVFHARYTDALAAWRGRSGRAGPGPRHAIVIGVGGAAGSRFRAALGLATVEPAAPTLPARCEPRPLWEICACATSPRVTGLLVL